MISLKGVISLARFNQTKKVAAPDAVSYEGGAVYEKKAFDEWINMLFSDYMEDSFYESGEKKRQRFHALTQRMIAEEGAKFVAKAAFFARNELGMRTVAQMVAAELNAAQFEEKRRFFHAFPHRPDDVAEVFAAVDYLGGKRSHALVRGFGDYLRSLNTYQLGKYKMNSREYNLYDCINITHANSAGINAFKKGSLESPDTWEVKISTAANNEEREQEWVRLVEEEKLGYLALIRNLNNILSVEGITEHWIAVNLCPQITNTKKIHQSLVFPYQIYSAYKNLKVQNLEVVVALSHAFYESVKNMPKLEGSTCIILDVSGSMDDPISYRSNISIKEAGAVYAAAIMCQNHDADFIKFGTKARKLNRQIWVSNIFSIIERLYANDGCGYGTDLVPAMEKLTQHYDRIFLISDMQIMNHNNSWGWYIHRPQNNDLFKDYCRKYGACKLYSFDLGNYHTQVGNPSNPDVYFCTALSEKVLKFISLLENGEDLRSQINRITFL